MRDLSNEGERPLAYESKSFLESADGRILRILAEYAEPLARFRRERIRDTVVFFGSARFHAQREDQTLTPSPGSHYYEDARQLAALHTQWTRSLFPEQEKQHYRFVICTGGGPGIMEAANRGALEAGGKSIGLNIRLPHEQRPNDYITPELSMDFHYFFMRKFWFAYLAKALVVFPGGFGTLDELFEILTLAQTGKLAKSLPVILYGRDYWDRVLHLEALVEAGAIAAKDCNLFTYAETPQDAFTQLQQALSRVAAEGPSDAEYAAPEIAHTLR